MTEKIGIIQGRLSPPAGKRLQAFPVGRWEEEFPKAHSCGLDAIEWIFEYDGYRENPLWKNEGIERILELSKTHAIEVPSICADYFMKRMFFRTSVSEKRETLEILKELVRRAALLGIRRLLLPVLEEAEISNDAEEHELVTALRECFPIAENFGMELAIESNLEVERYRSLMEALGHPLAKIYYDIGNRAAMGYPLKEEIRELGRWISGVHVKDRKRSGPSVPLGEGDADFADCFRTLHEIGFQGPYILQTARRGDEIENAKRSLSFVKRYLDVKEQLYEESKGPFR